MPGGSLYHAAAPDAGRTSGEDVLREELTSVTHSIGKIMVAVSLITPRRGLPTAGMPTRHTGGS